MMRGYKQIHILYVIFPFVQNVFPSVVMRISAEEYPPTSSAVQNDIGSVVVIFGLVSLVD